MKRVLALLGAAILLLLAVLVANTLRPGTAAPPAAARVAEPAPAFDAEAAGERFAQSLRFPTVSYSEPERLDAEAFAGFRSFLRAAYPRVFASLRWEEINTHSLLGHWPGSAGSGKPVMFLAHSDVVPVDPADAGKWTVEPFGGEQREGFVWGRGALDDKVNLISILEAIDALLAVGWAPRQDLYFGFGHDEEVGGEQGAAKIAEVLAARGISLDWMVDEGGAISLPAINAMTRVTQAPTLLAAGVKDNVQPTEARAVVNFRMLPGWSIERTRARVAEIVAAHGVEVRIIHANEASPTPSSITGAAWEALDASIQAAWRESSGTVAEAGAARLTVVPFLVMGGTDLKRFESIAGELYRFSFMPMAKADFQRVHGIDERVPVAVYLDNIRFYSHLLRHAGTLR